MHKQFTLIALVTGSVFLMSGCTGEESNRTGEEPRSGDTASVQQETVSHYPEFNADSAYAFIETQVSFGPRVPGTPAHAFTARWLISKLKSYCDTVYVQDGRMLDANRQPMPIINIIGSFKPDAKERILLAAHWDTRPMADEDSERPTEPADGANDGGSGVGVLLEIARQLHKKQPQLGIDIIFFDAEDGGTQGGSILSWCLGSQYWSKVPHVKDYDARFGILLDMVGAEDAIFPFEGHSSAFAPEVLMKVWKAGQKLGFGDRFLNIQGNIITDDHIFINEEAGIPTIDIIHTDVVGGRGFGDYWHTHKDNMDIIHKPTLKAVGTTVLHVVYNER